MNDDSEFTNKWLNCFLATYTIVGAISTIFVAIAAIIKKDQNANIVGVICGISTLQLFLVLLMLHCLRRTYDLLGFPPAFKDKPSEDHYYAEAHAYARRGKKIRQFSEKIIHVSLIVQVVLLWRAWL